MRLKDIETMLDLCEPWKLTGMEVDHEAKIVRLTVRCEESTLWADASGQRLHVHGWEKRQWRHMDFWQYETVLEAEVPRVKDPATGETWVVNVPWAEKGSRWTKCFERLAVEWLGASRSVEEGRQLLRLSWNSANGLIIRGVKRGLHRREQEVMPLLGIDEKSFGRRQSYVSVLVDIKGKRVLEVVKDATKEAGCELLGTLSAEQRDGVVAVALYRSPTYVASVEQELPEALIVHDRYHLSAELNKAVDQVRRAEHKVLQQCGIDALTGTRYYFLMVPEDMSGPQLDRFTVACRVARKTARAWDIKEVFAQLWDQPNREEGEKWFEPWFRRTVRCRIPVMVKLAQSFRRSKERILTWFEHRITNATSEGFNSVIQQLRAAARGFRNFEFYRSRILFHCGKLDLVPV
jgi:transposase